MAVDLGPFFDKRKKSFFIRLLNHCSMKIVRINSTYVHVFKHSICCFVCILNAYSSIHFFGTFLKLSTDHIEVYVDGTANGGHWKQSNFQWQPFKIFKFQIHNNCPPLKILWVSKISCKWNHFLTTYYIC